ncbi:MAG: DNA-processing protein DprA [Polyangiales bacterium]
MHDPRMTLPAAPERLEPDHPSYPRLPPGFGPTLPSIRVAGELPPWSPCVAVVGTRRPDPEAAEFAFELGRALAVAGVVVMSGGALGIDAAAHEGALAGGGRTVAVLGTGLDRAYPPTHGRLFERIAARGALVTTAPDGAAAHKGRFLRRNELVAALADSVVVVQAPDRSGALSTAAAARRFGRGVFAVPAAPWDVRGRGGSALLRRGALVCTSPEDVLSVSAPERRPVLPGRSRESTKQCEFEDFGGDEGIVLSALGSRPRHVDEVARATGLPAARVQRTLLTLLLGGQVDERDGGRYVRATRNPRR